MKRVERVRAQTNLQKEIKYPSVHQKRTGCFIETLYLLAITVFNVTFVEHILCVCLNACEGLCVCVCVREWVSLSFILSGPYRKLSSISGVPDTSLDSVF